MAAAYAVVPAEVLAPKPLRLSHVEAAALLMGGLTAWQALFVHGRLARGERVLVTGASGGVGHIAVQLARHAGATVVESGPVDLVFDTRGGEVPAGLVALAWYLAFYEVEGVGRGYPDRFRQRVEGVTVADVQRVAQKYMRNIRFVVLGNPKSVDTKVFTRETTAAAGGSEQ